MSSESRHLILVTMAIIFILISVAAGTDYDPAKTYEFIEKGNGPIDKRQIFGHIVEKRPDGWLVEIDAPWETRRIVTLRDDMLESGPLLETEAMREKRLEDGWAAKGFAKVTTVDGKQSFVSSREVALAERARRAAPDTPQPFPIPHEALIALQQPAPVDPTETETPNSRVPLAKRAAQIILVISGLVLTALIAKTTLLTES